VCNSPLAKQELPKFTNNSFRSSTARGFGRGDIVLVDDFVVGALRAIRPGDAEIVHMLPALKKNATHIVGDHGMAGGK